MSGSVATSTGTPTSGVSPAANRAGIHDHGPLRSHVTRTVHEYLDCGRLYGGFARLRCPKCHGEHLLAFSCQTRNFCPSCPAKRAALFGEQLELHTLADVPHRHVVFTIPKALRGLFQRDRRLLGLLTRCAHACVQTLLREVTGHPRAQVGMVNALQTFGSYAANNGPRRRPRTSGHPRCPRSPAQLGKDAAAYV